MAKRKRKTEVTEEELIEREIERNAAHETPMKVEQETKDLTEEEVEQVAEAMANADVEADNEKPNSVVAVKYKDKYLQQARERGIPGKAAKRSNWDWLSQQIASACLNDKHKISIPAFKELLDLNGVDHSRWTNQNKGWEGRFRMTGRVALQKRVANHAVLFLSSNTSVAPPEEFVAKYRDKE